jgi:hypothetical protein
MAARNPSKPAEFQFKLKQESDPEPEHHPDLIAALPDGIQRIESTAWQSSSRENWTYDINTKAEAEAEAERILENDPRARMTEEQLEAERLQQIERKKDIGRLVAKAKAMNFKVGYNDLGVWKGEYQKSALEEVQEITVQKKAYIPESISVANLSHLLKVSLGLTPNTFFLLLT